MKKIIYAAVSALLLSFTGLSHAQITASSPVDLNSSENDERYFANASTASKAAKKMEIANARAEKDFKRKFDTKSSVRWARDGQLILASFKENGIRNMITYKENGAWFRTIKTYEGALLKKSIAKLVNSNYNGYTISLVNEVFEPGFHCHFVSIHKGKDYKQVVVYDRAVMVYKEFVHQ